MPTFRLNRLILIVSAMLCVTMMGCAEDAEEKVQPPAHLIATHPPDGGEIEIGSLITLTFDLPPRYVIVGGRYATVKRQKAEEGWVATWQAIGLSPGPAVLNIQWDTGHATLTLTAIVPPVPTIKSLEIGEAQIGPVAIVDLSPSPDRCSLACEEKYSVTSEGLGYTFECEVICPPFLGGLDPELLNVNGIKVYFTGPLQKGQGTIQLGIPTEGEPIPIWDGWVEDDFAWIVPNKARELNNGQTYLIDIKGIKDISGHTLINGKITFSTTPLHPIDMLKIGDISIKTNARDKCIWSGTGARERTPDGMTIKFGGWVECFHDFPPVRVEFEPTLIDVIEIHFRVPIQQAGQIEIRLYPGRNLNWLAEWGNDFVRLIKSEPLINDRLYVIEMVGIKDTYGNTYDGTIFFRTKAVEE